MDARVPFDCLRAALEEARLSQAVLSHPETLARLGCFEMPCEDWPVSNPFVPLPALLCLGPDDAVVVAADFHRGDVRDCTARVVTYRSYDFERAPTRRASSGARSSRHSTTRALHPARPASRRRASHMPSPSGCARPAGRPSPATPQSPRRGGRAGRATSTPSGAPAGSPTSEEPRITPYSERHIDEGMVLALEPAIYLAGWGGIRLEHVFAVHAGGNEILTEFEHTL
jgi:hypothetical protein